MIVPLVALISLATSASAIVVNTFDGEGFPSCHNVSAVLYPTTVNEIQSLVKDAVSKGLPVRGSGGGHSWYDTMCSDDPRTIVIKTENVNQITDLNMAEGSVVVEAGVTFLQLSTWLHQRNASIGYTLVNWNITIAGAIAMGAHRSSLREESLVTAGALALDIINGKGDLVHLEKDNSDDWLAASTSLGLLGIISRVKFKVRPDFKVYANQKILSEDEVVNGDIYGLISPYATANFWWWPTLKKFHLRFYDEIDISDPGNSLQNTFSLSDFEAGAAKALLYPGVVLPSSNGLAETLFFGIWSAPNFRDKNTQLPILAWPTTGWAYDVLIGGLYPDQKPEWELDLHGKTLELAVPVTQANALFKRVRQLFDESEKAGKPMHATYRSGINIKFGKAYNDLLCQSTPTSNADWSKGVIMLDFPSFITTDGKRYNEEFYQNLARVVMDEFPARPHWTKNTREIFQYGKKNIDAGHLARFKAVRAKFDPNNTFKSVLSETLGV